LVGLVFGVLMAHRISAILHISLVQPLDIAGLLLKGLEHLQGFIQSAQPLIHTFNLLALERLHTFLHLLQEAEGVLQTVLYGWSVVGFLFPPVRYAPARPLEYILH